MTTPKKKETIALISRMVGKMMPCDVVKVPHGEWTLRRTVSGAAELYFTDLGARSEGVEGWIRFLTATPVTYLEAVFVAEGLAGSQNRHFDEWCAFARTNAGVMLGGPRGVEGELG